MCLSDAQFEQYQRDGYVVGDCLDGALVECVTERIAADMRNRSRFTDEDPPAWVGSERVRGETLPGCV